MTDIINRVGFQVKNDSGMNIPPCSVVVVTSVEITKGTRLRDPEVIHHIDQYGCAKPGNVMVTGEVTIRKGDKGRAYFDQFLYVAINTADSDPAPGQEWGPLEGSFIVTKGGKGFFAQGYSLNNATPKRAMFLRTFVRAPTSICSNFSNSSGSGSSSGSTSVTGSSSSSQPCGCITVVTGVSCGPAGLSVTTGQARGCC